MKQQSTSKGFAILSAANIIVKILSFIYLPFLLKILHSEGYGIYSVSYQVYIFIYVIANSGLPASISKIIAEFTALNRHKDALNIFRLSRRVLFITGLVMSILLYVLAGPVTSLMHYEKSYMAVLALAPSILLTSVSSAYRGYFQGRSNMFPTAISQIFEQLINTIFTLAFAFYFMKYGVEAACAGGAAATTLAALVSLIILIILFKKSNEKAKLAALGNEGTPTLSRKRLLKRIINYSLPITLCIGLQYAGNLVDLGNTKARLLAAGFSDTKATVLYGYLAKFQQLSGVPLTLVTALTAVILPAISRAVVLKEKDLIKRNFDYAFRLCFLITVPSAVGLSILSTPIYDLLRFQPGSYLMKYGSVIIVLMSVQMIQISILQGAKRFNTATTNAILGILVKIIVNYILIANPAININGALLGSISGYMVSISLNAYFIGKFLKIKQSLIKKFARPLLSSITEMLKIGRASCRERV